jgi:CRISPR system Cascade subunit CasB
MSEDAFINWLENLSTQKRVWTRARAVLRRSLAFEPGAYPPALPYVEPLVPPNSTSWQRDAHYLVAGLYAYKDAQHLQGRSLPAALREEARRRRSDSVERRFLALLDADRDQIAFRLRQAVSLIEGGLDFQALLQDLLRWFHPSRYVQTRWAREFYTAGDAGDAQRATLTQEVQT